jgi:transketolase
MDVCSKTVKSIEADSHWVRKRILELSLNAGKKGAHVGGSLSVVEILCSLYSYANWDDGINRDRIILSKGHAAMALFCVLERKGRLLKSETDTFEKNGSHYYAHAKRNQEKSIEFSGGSLSLGISYAVGVALACKAKKLESKVYVVVGDGECDEGLVWESAMAASNYHLDNFTVIVDCNGIQSDGFTDNVMSSAPLSNKFKAFGFDSYDVDGHDANELLTVLQAKQLCPRAVIAHTVKGKGISSIENKPEWHHGVVTPEFYRQMVSELDE